MRFLVALLLVASVLHTQLAVGCHCHHEGHDEAAHGDCLHGVSFEVHEDHRDDSRSSNPCDGCAECEKGDPVAVRMAASPDGSPSVELTVWMAPPAKATSGVVQHERNNAAPPPAGVRSLLACGTLLRI